MTIEELESRIIAIEKRNIKVEENKAWETSWTRKISLILGTYLIISLTLITIHNPAPLVNAIIPAIGFFLSTLSLPFIKRYWLRHIYLNRGK